MNRKRQGQRYKPSADAILIRSMDLKSYITDNPLLQYFSMGTDKEGYWKLSHAKLQLEDAIVIISELFPYNYLFLYNQLSGHTKMR